MYQRFLTDTRDAYLRARETLIHEPRLLVQLERVLAESITVLANSFLPEAVRDYDDASALYPFWQNYPPDERGRAPRGDQFPWIEVGEHAVGRKLARYLPELFGVSDIGFPTGPDERFLVNSRSISDATEGMTDTVWLAIDIKSVGPRDDSGHAVMGQNQISGNGEWSDLRGGVSNRFVEAVGARRSHLFHPALPPLLVLQDGIIAPTVTMVIKPVYTMLPSATGVWSGQPLGRLDLISIPNGLLLCENPGYLSLHPGLLYPGKDEKTKNPLKVRARVSFGKLQEIAQWRVSTIWSR